MMKRQDITALFSGQVNSTEYSFSPGPFLCSVNHVLNELGSEYEYLNRFIWKNEAGIYNELASKMSA